MTHRIIRLARPADRPAIDSIYAHYVRTSTCTYQEEPDTDAERAAWFATHGERHPVTVVEADGQILGWGSLSPWKARSGYRHTVELSVYLRPESCGQGIGKELLADLIERATALGYHSLIGGVSSDQTPSLRLHEGMGFTRVAHLKEVGHKFGRWLDVIYLQRMLAPQGAAD
jgi:phosphinothricin acetyltransferase